MTIDLQAAAGFMAAHARVLDCRRVELRTGGGDPAAVLAAVDGYRNPDGGYGWGLEPDLRCAESQPGGALHAFEAMHDALPATTPRAAQLADWLAASSLPDGGLPFALPMADPTGSAPFWANADPTASSLQITAYVAAIANRIAAHDSALAGHAWLAAANAYCMRAIEALDDAPHALVLTAALGFLDAVHESDPAAAELMVRLGRLIPDDGCLKVAGGLEEETVHPLDIAPLPGRPLRALFSPATIAADRARLAAAQQEDGGWRVDFRSYSPAGALEWRGHMTVRAVGILESLPKI
jgi:hypothetical protein